MAVSKIYHYQVEMSFDLGAVHNPTKEFIGSINDIMGRFGFNEKLHARTTYPLITFESNRLLHKKEKAQFSITILNFFNERLPNMRVEIHSIKLDKITDKAEV